jgi:tetratricopeptide (TPR) repeat protein
VLLQLLIQEGRTRESAEMAEQYYSDEGGPVTARIQAAAVLYGATRHLAEAEAQPVFERLAADLPTFAALPGFADTPSTMQGLAYTVLGLSCAALDKPEAARKALDMAIAVDAGNNAALVARALVVARADPEAAAPDFQQAVERGTSLVIPYLFLAQRAILGGDFADVIHLSERALHLGPSPEQEAELHHLHAMARLSLHQPAEAVRGEFVTSLRLDPLNEGIRRNFEYFERRRLKAPPTEWQRAMWPSPVVLDAGRAREALRDITLLAA